MASLKGKKTVQSLLSKGFKVSDTHHHYFEFWHDGKFVAKTKTSHNSQDIGDGLIDAMRKQCKVSKQFFKEFAICTKSQQDYINELKNNGII